MLSNYPPGVTGNEPEIAGYPEHEEDLECEGGVVQGPDGGDVECGWTGRETVYISHGEGVWHCPKCGLEQRFDLEDEYGPDPDAAWDARFDNDYEDGL